MVQDFHHLNNKKDNLRRNDISYFYDGQTKSLIKQIIRSFSNFKTKVIGKNGPELRRIPCKYADTNSMVSWITKSGSENTALTAPMIAVWLQNMNISRQRTQNPAGISDLLVNEKQYNDTSNSYDYIPSSRYHVERLMPTPIDLTFQVDVLTSNIDMKLEIIEQIMLVFNPSIEIQKNNNALDWTSIERLELKSLSFTNRSIPIGSDISMDITSFSLDIPAWISPPARITKQNIINVIKNNIMYNEGEDNGEVKTWQSDDFTSNIATIENHKIQIEDGYIVTLLGKYGDLYDMNGNVFSWKKLLNDIDFVYDPINSYLRFRPYTDVEFTTADVFSTFKFHSINENQIIIEIDPNTLPSTTLPSVNAVISPKSNYIGSGFNPIVNDNYIITDDIIPGTAAWGIFSASAHSIISYDGANWHIILDFPNTEIGQILYVKNPSQLLVSIIDGWISVIDGQYTEGFWKLQSFKTI